MTIIIGASFLNYNWIREITVFDREIIIWTYDQCMVSFTLKDEVDEEIIIKRIKDHLLRESTIIDLTDFVEK